MRGSTVQTHDDPQTDGNAHNFAPDTKGVASLQEHREPKSRVNIRDYKDDYEMFSDGLSDETFPKNSDWLMVASLIQVMVERIQVIGIAVDSKLRINCVRHLRLDFGYKVVKNYAFLYFMVPNPILVICFLK